MKTLDDIQIFVLDMDGTIYLGDSLLPGVKEFLAFIERRGIPYLFLTNNSSKHRGLYAEKLAGLGLIIPEELIVTSGEATAIYIKNNYPEATVYLVGTPALEEEFSRQGVTIDDENPGLVVLGFDTTLTYDKLRKLCDFVRDGRRYIATHPDFNCPVEGGYMPDIGAMIAFVEASTGRRPDIIVGKPHPPIVEALVEKTGQPAEALCMVGDRLYTDIALGTAGMTTALVLSGETSREDLLTASYRPDFVFDDLGALAQAMNQTE